MAIVICPKSLISKFLQSWIINSNDKTEELNPTNNGSLICDCFLLLQSNLGWHNGKHEINNMHVQASNKLITIFLEYRLTLPSFQF